MAAELPETLPRACSTSWNNIFGENEWTWLNLYCNWNFCVDSHIMFPYLPSLFLFPETLLPWVLVLWPPTRSGQTGLWCYGAWPRVETEALTPWPICRSSRLVCASLVWDWMLQHCNYFTNCSRPIWRSFPIRFGFKDLFKKKRGASLLQNMAIGAGNTERKLDTVVKRLHHLGAPKVGGFACLLLTSPPMVYDISFPKSLVWQI